MKEKHLSCVYCLPKELKTAYYLKSKIAHQNNSDYKNENAEKLKQNS